MTANGVPTEPDVAGPAAREFFTTRTVAEARAGFRPGRRTPAETVPLTDALHRVPAAAVTAPHALPGFARSTVDGYAVRAADTYGVSEGLPGYLEVAGAVRMGAEPDMTVGPGTVASMPTGGVLPPGADAVVMIEYTQEAMPGTIEVVRPVAPGDGVVRADEDAAAGAELAPAGRRLRAHDLGMLAAAGVTSVSVHARPRVTVISTGDEVVTLLLLRPIVLRGPLHFPFLPVRFDEYGLHLLFLPSFPFFHTYFSLQAIPSTISHKPV